MKQLQNFKPRIGLFLILLVMGISSSMAQSKTVTGRITDERLEPLIGVSITVKGSTAGTASNSDGLFSISAPGPQSVLIFSYLGYEPQEITVGAQAKIDVILKERQTALDEVVVVGYGTQKKANLTGSVSSLKVSDVTDIPVSNTASLLQGRMSGVTVSTFTAQPGKEGDVEIKVRGIGTFGNSNPMVIIDGIEGNLSSVAPNDIESI